MRIDRRFSTLVGVISATGMVLTACERKANTPLSQPSPKETQISASAPVPFGYKTQWFAVPECRGETLAKAIGMPNVKRVSWSEGMKLIESKGGVFITPSIAGWTLAIGEVPSADEAAWTPLIENLSREFGRTYYFGTHRVVEYHAWARAEKGTIVRAFGYLGERDETFLNVGPRSPEEVQLGIGESSGKSPDEESVLNLAGKWVIDPRTLDKQPSASGQGWFCSPN
jgi:hypothetical protein